MRILLYSDYPALLEALQEESKRYSGIELFQANPDTEILTLPDFQFLLLAPLAETTEVGATPCTANQLNTWQQKISHLVELCSLRQAQLTLISSDLVFSTEQTAVNEQDNPESTTPLAKSLLQLEKTVAAMPQSIILRTAPTLSATPKGGLAQVLASCKKQQAPQAISYRGLQPLDDLARILLSIILQLDAGAKACGLFHYAGSEPLSQSQLFATLKHSLKLETNLNKETEHQQLTLSTQHLLETFGIHPRAWREKLPALLEQLNEAN